MSFFISNGHQRLKKNLFFSLTFMAILICLPPPFSFFSIQAKESFSSSTSFLAEKNSLIMPRDWYLQSSFLVKEKGEKISSSEFRPKGWFKTQLPTTVLAALVRHGVYPEPTVGLNNMKIPDAHEEYSHQWGLARYSHLPGKRHPWRDPYWFWTRFLVPDKFRGQHIWLNLHGVNYRAEVWLNGQLVADAKKIAGMFGQWSLDVTGITFWGKSNTLAILVFPLDFPGLPAEPQLRTFGSFGENGGPTGDIGKNVTMQCSIGWDWIPEVRDRNMGLWQPVTLSATGPVDINYPVVISKIIGQSEKNQLASASTIREATLIIKAELRNLEKSSVTGNLRARIRPANFSLPRQGFLMNKNEARQNGGEIYLEKEIELAPLEKREIMLDEAEWPQLRLQEPKLWWPADMGFPHLYELELSFIAAGLVSDQEKIRFGIREIATQVTEVNGWKRRDFFLNGKRLFLRGGAWVPEMLLRREADPYWLQRELLLWRHAHLNLVRLWGGGVTPPEEFFQICDELGLLVWHDFWITGDCQATWGKGSRDWPIEASVFLDNARSTILRLRHHPSLLLWTAGNEGYPRKEIYQPLRDELIARLDGTRPFLPSSGYTEPPAAWGLSWPDNQPAGSYSGGPYYWVNPKEYYNLVEQGKDWLFKNEVGLPSLPLLPSLKKFLLDFRPSSDLPFPLNHLWGQHDACEGNGKYSLYDKAIRQRYGEPKSLTDYVWKAQLINAENYRAIFEAANQALEQATGVILWKTNAAWPSVMWQLYDYYLRPTAAYYFARRAGEPLHPQLDLRDKSVWVINQQPEKAENLWLQTDLYALDGQKIWSREEKLTVEGGKAKKLWPVVISQASFCVLRLYSLAASAPKETRLLAENYYWLSPDDDLRALQNLPQVKLQAEIRETTQKGADNLSLSPLAAENRKAPSSLSSSYNSQAHISQLVELNSSRTSWTASLRSWKIKLHNPTPNLAFFIYLSLRTNDGEEPLPCFWEDNFLLLPPGEEKEINVWAFVPAAKKISCYLEGWNLVPCAIKPRK